MKGAARAALAGAVMLATAGHALALSCMPQDAARTFQRANEAEERYLVAYGELTFDPEELPEQDLSSSEDRSTSFPAIITGVSLTAEGFTQAFDQPITVDAKCLGPWCPSLTPGTPLIAFLEQRPSGYTLLVDACGGMIVSEPAEEDLETIVQCSRGGDCEPAN